MQNQSNRKKVLAVASIGGHWIQLLRIVRPLEDRFDLVYVSTHPKCAAMVDGQPFYQASDFSRTDAWRIVPAFVRLFKIVRKENPDVVITTGAAPGLIGLVAGWMLKKRTIWIDSVANAECLSMSGRIASKFASKTYTQWKHLATDKVKYAGDIYG